MTNACALINFQSSNLGLSVLYQVFERKASFFKGLKSPVDLKFRSIIRYIYTKFFDVNIFNFFDELSTCSGETAIGKGSKFPRSDIDFNQVHLRLYCQNKQTIK